MIGSRPIPLRAESQRHAFCRQQDVGRDVSQSNLLEHLRHARSGVYTAAASMDGERRLNVLISRAKQRCEVFSSMTDEDIDPDFAQSRKGVFAFRLGDRFGVLDAARARTFGLSKRRETSQCQSNH